MKGILINNGKALGDGSGKVFTVQSEKGNPVTVYTEGEMNSLIIAENVDKIFKYIGDDGEYTKDHIYQVVDGNGTLTIKDLSMGIALPPVTNINLNSSGVLYWDKPDMSNIDTNFTFISISYEIEFNGASLTSDKESVNVYSYIVEGQNTASVKAIGVFKFNVNNKEKEALVEYKTPETLAIFVLGEKLPTKLSGSASALVGTNAYIFGGQKYTTSSSYSNEILKFNINEEKITKLETTLPSAVKHSVAIVSDKTIYIFGGASYSSSNKIYKFDSETETLTTLETILPKSMQKMLGAKVGNIIYLIGGESKSSSGGTVSYKEIVKFDVETETIIETLNDKLSSITTDYISFTTNASVVIDNDIYFVHGTNLYKFDTVAEELTLTLVSKYLDQGTAVVNIGTNIYSFGHRNYKNYIFRMDLNSKTGTLLEEVLPHGLAEMSSVAIGSTAYMFGGTTGFGSSYYVDEILKVINLS